MAYNYTKFDKVDNIGDSTVGVLLRDNLISFFSWAFVDSGAFYNDDPPGPGIHRD